MRGRLSRTEKMSHAPNNSTAAGVLPAAETAGPAGALALATGSACLEIAMPIGRKILLRDAPPILWRKLQEDLNNRLEEMKHGSRVP